MLAIFKHELKSCFHSLSTYVCGAFLLVFIGIGALFYNIQQSVSNFEFVLGFGSIVFAIVIPILTMKVLSEEKKQKTDQLLYSLPITTTDVILGKYWALMTAFTLPILIIAVYPLVFSKFGEVYLPTSYGSVFAFFLVGAALVAFGIFISSLTENQGLAAGISIALILFNYFSVQLAEYVSSSPVGSAAAIIVLIAALGLIINHLTGDEKFSNIVTIVLLGLTVFIYFADPEIFDGLLPSLMKNLSLFDRLYI